MKSENFEILARRYIKELESYILGKGFLVRYYSLNYETVYYMRSGEEGLLRVTRHGDNLFFRRGTPVYSTIRINKESFRLRPDKIREKTDQAIAEYDTRCLGRIPPERKVYLPQWKANYFRTEGEPEYNNTGRRLRILWDINFRDRLSEAQNWRCAACGRLLDSIPAGEKFVADWRSTVEHVIPFSEGGADDESNIVMMHYRCNRLYRHGNIVHLNSVEKDEEARNMLRRASRGRRCLTHIGS